MFLSITTGRERGEREREEREERERERERVGQTGIDR